MNHWLRKFIKKLKKVAVDLLAKIKDKAEFSYLQFFICLQVFKELGIVVTNDGDTEIVNITDVKKPLNASVFYNKLNTIISTKK